MDELIIRAIDDMYFRVMVPCQNYSERWVGMIGTPDVQIIVMRGYEHMRSCEECKRR